MTLAVISLAWLVAIAMVAAWDAPWWVAGTALALLIPAALSGRLPIGYGLLVAAAIAAFAGGARYSNWDQKPPPPLQQFVGQQVDIRGEVSSLPERRLTTAQLRIDLSSVNSMSTQGAVLVTTSQYADWLPGDRVRIVGRLDEPPVFDTFDYRGYLARQGIVGTMFYPTFSLEGTTGGPDRAIAATRRNLEQA